MSSSDLVEFECPECRKAIQVANDQAGQRMACPECHQPFVVPDASPSNESASNESASSESDDEDLFAGLDDLEHSEAGTVDSGEDISVPIKVEGISDSESYDDVYGIQCRICDTQIHVRPEQLGTQVECPTCFSQVMVTPSKKRTNTNDAKKNAPGDNELPRLEPLDSDGGGELRLSEPIKRPESELPYGLDPATEDLLSPKPSAEKSDEPVDSSPNSNEDEIKVDTESDLPEPKPTVVEPIVVEPIVVEPAAPQKETPSRRDRLEASQRSRDQANEDRSFRNLTGETNRLGDETDFPDPDLGSTATAVINMLRSPGLLWRLLAATLVMSFGVVIMESYAPIYIPEVDVESADRGATFLKSLVALGQWAIFGALPYLLGLMSLWYVCSYVFRDAALGQRQVKSWHNAGLSEISGTFSLFAFGFFIAGLPMIVPEYLGFSIALPFQIMLAPLFLLSAWFNQSPFAIVSVDAFGNIRQQKSQWTAFYTFMLALAFSGILLAILFLARDIIPFFGVNVIISVIGTAAMALLTAAFASACGWHSGRIVRELKETA